MSTKVLIIGSDREEDGVRQRTAGRALLWGFEQHGIDWDIHQPRTAPFPDLRSYDAILCWSYMVYRLSNDYIPGAQEIEAHARSLDIPVINSVERCAAGHSFFLETWRAHGIYCARSQRFKSFNDIRLDYPLLLRRDGVHQGKDFFLAQTPEEARELIQARQKDGAQENLNLAIEFVDVRDEHGYYNKYRSFVVGDEVIPAHVFVSKHWLVNYGEFVDNDLAVRSGQDFMQHGERNKAEVLAAARLTGSDVLALDYAKRADGRYVFWEANRHFLTLEDYGETPNESFLNATGVDADRRQKMFEALGLALSDLVIERVGKSTAEG